MLLVKCVSYRANIDARPWFHLIATFARAVWGGGGCGHMLPIIANTYPFPRYLHACTDSTLSDASDLCHCLRFKCAPTALFGRQFGRCILPVIEQARHKRLKQLTEVICAFKWDSKAAARRPARRRLLNTPLALYAHWS